MFFFMPNEDRDDAGMGVVEASNVLVRFLPYRARVTKVDHLLQALYSAMVDIFIVLARTLRRGRIAGHGKHQLCLGMSSMW